MTYCKLVPVEPTLEMMEAGAEGCGQDLDRDEARGRAFVAYKAMLAAAPDHIADTRKMVSDQLRGGTKKIGRPQIREVFLRNGFTIKPGCDDLREYVYKAAFELLELAAPAVQGEPVAWRYRMLSEDWEKIATIHPSTFHPDHKDLIIEPLYTAPQPAEQKPSAGDSLMSVPDEVFAAEFAAWWDEHGQFCRAGGGTYERSFAFEAWRHLYPQLMNLQMAAAKQQSAPVFSDEDHVSIPRGLIAAACSAIDKKRDGTKTLAELRRYTFGDLSKQPAPEMAMLVAALEKARDAIASLPKDALGNVPDTQQCQGWHIRDELINDISTALAAHRKQGGES